jgi:hypothetical protein
MIVMKHQSRPDDLDKAAVVVVVDNVGCSGQLAKLVGCIMHEVSRIEVM